MTTTDVSARVVPWDDQEFRRAFEQARAIALGEGLRINGPRAASRVERLLRQGGYPHAAVACERTPEQALAHKANWTVKRDGAAS